MSKLSSTRTTESTLSAPIFMQPMNFVQECWNLLNFVDHICIDCRDVGSASSSSRKRSRFVAYRRNWSAFRRSTRNAFGCECRNKVVLPT